MRLMSASRRDFSQSVSTYHDLCPDEDNLQIVIKDTVVWLVSWAWVMAW